MAKFKSGPNLARGRRYLLRDGTELPTCTAVAFIALARIDHEDVDAQLDIAKCATIDSQRPKPTIMKILLIEDEPKTLGYLRKGLSEEGFVIDTAVDGDAGLHLAKSITFDLIILDVMLPGSDGWHVVTELRHTGQQTPVLFLTARDSVPDRVKGFELGADDYLVKPFAFSELLARVRSLLRRAPARQLEILRVADLEVDLLRHRATRGGQRIDLTGKEFQLLSLLVRRAGEILTRTAIAEAVWDMNFDSDTNVVDVHIRRLRAKIDDPFERKLIRTVRGAGYVLDHES